VSAETERIGATATTVTVERGEKLRGGERKRTRARLG